MTERLLQFRIEAPISAQEYWILRSEISETLWENISRLNAEQTLSVRKEVQEAVPGFFPNGEMSFPAQMIIVTATKPVDAEI